MTLETTERDLEAGEQEAHAIVVFVASLDTCQLQLMGSAIREELALRCEGKPYDRNMLH